MSRPGALLVAPFVSVIEVGLRRRTRTAIRFVAQMRFAFPNLMEGLRQIAVPLDGVECEIEMRVEDERCGHRRS